MDTRSLMWIILGVILVLGGIVSSLREGREATPRQRPVVVERLAEKPTPTPAQERFDTGFAIDPVRGLKRKDANTEYFK